MTATPSLLADLLADCDAHGVRLALTDGGGLTIDAPQEALTSDLLDRLKAHKAEVLAKLRAAPEPMPIGPEAATPKGTPPETTPTQPKAIPPETTPTQPAAATTKAGAKPVCRCGCATWRDVVLRHPPHHAATTRRDCGRCGRFLGFPIWHGTFTVDFEQLPKTQGR